MIRVSFKTEFDVEVEKDSGLVELLEDFVNRISKIMPMPELKICVSDTDEEE